VNLPAGHGEQLPAFPRLNDPAAQGEEQPVAPEDELKNPGAQDRQARELFP